jgi:hypothetical protein
MNFGRMVGFTSPFLEKSCGLAPLEKPHTLSLPRWARGTFLSPLYTPRTRSPLACSLRHLANFSSTEIKLSKISALSGKPYVTQHNPLNFFILVCEPPTAGDASQTGRQLMRRQRGDVNQEERPADQILAAHYRGKHTEGDYQDHADRHPQRGSEKTEDQTDRQAARDGH